MTRQDKRSEMHALVEQWHQVCDYSGLKPATHSGAKSASDSGVKPATHSGVK